MPNGPRLPRAMRFGLGGGLAALVITLLLWASGVLGDAAQVTAYATAVLAIGTTGLAAGAIGTYVEQRKTNYQQAQEIAQQAKELERGRINEMAQVRIERYGGPGEFGTVRVRNNTSRAIRNVYVWIQVRGVANRYHLVVKKEFLSGNDEMFRTMEHVPRGVTDGDDLQWRMRTILPHDEVNSEQIKFMHDNQPITTALQDSDMTAWAEFMDSDGHWWRCNEDGEVNPAPPSVPATVQPHPMRPAQGGSESQSTNS